MTNGQIRDLCTALLHAETEDEVVQILKKAGYWDTPGVWRYYGDVENNWGQSGNQQSLAEAALAEKLVNSVDARLINECLVRGIDPKSDKAPRSIREAVARFFEDRTGKKMATGGLIEDWGDDRIREVAQGITLVATGTRPTLNLTIADAGEGQSPRRLPNTILSLNRANKMYIPFVQGQFNQGGTGALRFCGHHNLQFVISRRNPALLGTDPDEGDKQWASRSCAASAHRNRPTAAATRSSRSSPRSASARSMKRGTARSCRSRRPPCQSSPTTTPPTAARRPSARPSSSMSINTSASARTSSSASG
jgi:hypothetical protein